MKEEQHDDNAVNWSINDYNTYNSTAQSYLVQWNTHAYAGSSSDRANAYNNIGVGANKRLWMSEWGAGSQGSQIGAGLALSNEILQDEQYLHPSAWVIWQAVNSGGGDPTDDWGLAYMDSNNTISYPTRYYAMGNYSEFVRPGYKKKIREREAAFRERMTMYPPSFPLNLTGYEKAFMINPRKQKKGTTIVYGFAARVSLRCICPQYLSTAQ